jgi:formylglycine-generating enzyme required for sulfatase activity
MMNALLLSLACSLGSAGDLDYSLLTDLVVDDTGDVYVADPGRRRIVCVSKRWGENRTIATFAPDGPIVWPGRLALGPKGKLFVSDPRTHRVAAIDLESGAATLLAGTGTPGLDRDGIATDLPLSIPTGIAYDGEQRLAIADLGNRAVRILDLGKGTIATVLGGWNATKTSKASGSFEAPDRFLPGDLAFTEEGELFVLDLLDLGVLEVDLDGRSFALISGTQDDPAGDPRREDRIANRQSFALAPGGALLFAEGAAGRVTKLAPGDAATRSLAKANLPWPSAVASDAKGNVHVATAHDASVLRIESDGSLTRVYRSETPPPDQFEKKLEVLRQTPDPKIVRDEQVRAALTETGRAWHVRHRATGIEFVLVPPGSYLRGARTTSEDMSGDARPQHEVRLTRPIYVSRTEVTNRQFRTLDPNHVSQLSFHHDLNAGLAGLTLDADEQPATTLGFHDAADFAARHGFRLPTEAEWEYFARAGAGTRYPWGDALEDGGASANLPSTKVRESIAIELNPVPYEDPYLLTAPVGRFGPNGFGLHDVVGNVWEWCADWYAKDEYARCAGGVTDPHGPASGERKVMRGSAWDRPFLGSEMLSFRGNPRPLNHFIASRGARMVLDPE